MAQGDQNTSFPINEPNPNRPRSGPTPPRTIQGGTDTGRRGVSGGYPRGFRNNPILNDTPTTIIEHTNRPR